LKYSLRYSPVKIERGFTLIELLIVVAIIAILAAIAVPNFLEAQVRAKVARVESDMRTLATALETYRLDNTGYPEYAVIMTPGGMDVEDPATAYGQNYFEHFSRVPGFCITTPVAYVSSIPPDLFAVGKFPGPEPRVWDFSYKNCRQNNRVFTGDRSSEPWLGANGEVLLRDWGEWRLSSGGPDGTRISDIKSNRIYDPTNGTLSTGDIVRSQRNPQSRPK
jgi:type II secretion system protein G